MKRDLVLHNLQGTDQLTSLGALSRLLAGVEFDLFIDTSPPVSGLWSLVVREHGQASSVAHAIQIMEHLNQLGLTGFLDVKCPRGAEEVAERCVIETLRTLTPEAAQRLYVISSNHGLISTLSGRVQSGPIIGDVLADLPSYLADVGAAILVTRRISVTALDVRALEEAGVQTVMFTVPTIDHLREAREVRPAGVMIDARDLVAWGMTAKLCPVQGGICSDDEVRHDGRYGS